TFLLSTSILTFGSAIIPSSAVFANENINQTNISNTLNLEQYENSPYCNTTYDSENNTTTVTISDSNLALFLASQGIDVPNELYNLARLRSAGVTKIVWHGKARYGNVDIYLSKAFLTNMSRKSRAAIIGALGGLVTGALGGAIIGVIADDIKGKTYKHGKVYVIRKFGYQYSYLQ
ncbi:hypothetical protein, partial [Enterococcus faecium]